MRRNCISHFVSKRCKKKVLGGRDGEERLVWGRWRVHTAGGDDETGERTTVISDQGKNRRQIQRKNCWAKQEMSCSPTSGDTTESLWSARDKDKADKADGVISRAVRLRLPWNLTETSRIRATKTHYKLAEDTATLSLLYCLRTDNRFCPASVYLFLFWQLKPDRKVGIKRGAAGCFQSRLKM